MSAREALHDEYFDGIPVDSGSPNYAKGLKALARYIDQELRNRDESLADRIDDVQEHVQEAKADITRLMSTVSEESVARKSAVFLNLKGRLDDLEHTVDHHKERISQAESGMANAQSTALEADQKADDTDRLVGEILETLDQEGLLHYVPTTEVAKQAKPAEKLSHLEVSELVRSTYPNASILGSTSAGHPNHSFHGTCAKINGQRYRISPRLHVEESGDGFLRGTDQAKELQRELRVAYFKDEWERSGDVYESLDELARATGYEYFLQVKANGQAWAQLRRSLDSNEVLVAEFKASEAKRRFKSLLQQRDVPFSTMYHVAGPDGVAFHQDDLAPDRARTLLLSCLSEHIAVDQ